MFYLYQVKYTDPKLKWMNNFWKCKIPKDFLFIQRNRVKEFTLP